MTGSNRRPSACKADALPAELITLNPRNRIIEILIQWSMLRRAYSEYNQILKVIGISSKINTAVGPLLIRLQKRT